MIATPLNINISRLGPVRTRICVLAILSALLLNACEKKENRAVLSDPEAPELLASEKVLLLEQSNKADTIVYFLWQAPDYGFDAVVSYTLEFDLSGNDFSGGYQVPVSPGADSYGFTSQDMNTLLLELGISPGEEREIQARIVASAGETSIQPLYSEPIVLRVRPFSQRPFIYVPGAYCGWDINKADSLSAQGNQVYQGIIHFSGSDLSFKINPQKNWKVSYGNAGGGKISPSAERNLEVSSAVRYQITVYLDRREIEIQPMQLSVIGDAIAGDWEVDQDMQYDNGKQLWTMNALLRPGEIRFRLNKDSNQSYGLGERPGSIALSGANIPFTQYGIYRITVDLEKLQYSFLRR